MWQKAAVSVTNKRRRWWNLCYGFHKHNIASSNWKGQKQVILFHLRTRQSKKEICKISSIMRQERAGYCKSPWKRTHGHGETLHICTGLQTNCYVWNFNFCSNMTKWYLLHSSVVNSSQIEEEKITYLLDFNN